MAFDPKVHNAVCPNCGFPQALVRKMLIRRTKPTCKKCGGVLDLPKLEWARIQRPFESERPEKPHRPIDVLTPGQLRDKIDNRAARERLADDAPLVAPRQSETESASAITTPPQAESTTKESKIRSGVNSPHPIATVPRTFPPRPPGETKLASGHLADYTRYGACSNPLGNEEAALRFLSKRPGWWRIDDPKSKKVWFVPPETESFTLPESGKLHVRPAGMKNG